MDEKTVARQKAGPKPKSLAERFWPKVDKNGPMPSHAPELGQCWVWLASVDKSGYAQLNHGKSRFAHHASFEIEHGRAPVLCVLHRCDNPRCVRPSHLFEGTQADNVRDMIAKGRRRHGGTGAPKKISDADVVGIRSARAAGEHLRAIAARYGVSKSLVFMIVSGQHRPGASLTPCNVSAHASGT